MAKTTGLATQFYVDGYDLSGDASALDRIACPSGTIDVTGLNTAGGHERLHGAMDGELSFSVWFNDAAAQEHIALRAKAGTYLMASIGGTQGNPAPMLVAEQINYDGTRGADGSLPLSVQALAKGAISGTPTNVGLEWGTDIIGGTDTLTSPGGAGDATVGEVTSQTTAGAAIQLHCISLASGTPTFIVQDSSDTTTGSDGSWATLKTATINSANSAERLTVAGTVEKGLRVQGTGTYTDAVIACGVRRGTAQDRVAYTGAQS